MMGGDGLANLGSFSRYRAHSSQNFTGLPEYSIQAVRGKLGARRVIIDIMHDANQ
jgi:hypothetical protein